MFLVVVWEITAGSRFGAVVTTLITSKKSSYYTSSPVSTSAVIPTRYFFRSTQSGHHSVGRRNEKYWFRPPLGRNGEF